MSNDSSAIVSKVWNYAHVLKNAGVGYGDYVEQITYQLFGSDLRSPGCCPTLWVAYVRFAPILKLADKMTGLRFDPPSPRYGRASNSVPPRLQSCHPLF
jgi:hypothetical protein